MILESMPTVATDFDVIDTQTGTGNVHAGSLSPGIAMSPANDSNRLMSMSMFIPEIYQQTSSNQNPLDLVTNCVDSFLQADSFFPQLTEHLKVSPDLVSISGRRDVDYPNLEEYGSSLKSLSQFVGLKTIPLPRILLEQFGQMLQRCEMGIFPAIGRAWLAIDTNVYLWKYDTSTDVAYYDASSRMIIKVDLVKPKEGALKSHIKYILVLATFTEIILLGITFSDFENPEDMGDLIVIPEPLFTLATDNVEVKILKSTHDGRIFFGGDDGCLYEICYQTETLWFGRNCRKVNLSTSAFSFLLPKILQNTKHVPIIQIEIDKTRNILYALNEEGDIELFDLGQDGKSATRVLQKTSNSIAHEASAAASTIDEANFKSVVSISAIEESESINLNLIAITKTGVRLYFTCTAWNSPDQRPCYLQLIHIRLPPGFAASSISHRPTSVQLTHYKKGNFIFITCQNENRDTLWALSSDSFAFRNELSELYTIIPLKTRIWSIAEEQNVIEYKPYQSFFLKNKTFALETPAIVTQHLESPKKFVFLTTQGVIIGYKPRLVDQLKQLLLENQGYDNDAVKSFFHLHSSSFQSNPCVFALILACDSYPPGEEKIIEWATSAFFHYGSEQFDQKEIYSNQMTSNITPYKSTPLSSPFMTPGGDKITSSYSNSPMQDNSFKLSPVTMFGQQQTQMTPQQHFKQNQSSNFPLANYSSKCRGLFIYFSRIIRPIWNLKTVNIDQSQTSSGLEEVLISNISVDEIKVYLLRLTSLCNFMKHNLKFSVMDSDKYLGTTMNDQQMFENNILWALFKLIEHCLEVLNLWKLLCVHQFHVILSDVSKEKQNQLSNMNFKELIVFGSEMTTLLASALVRRFIEDHSTTDIINKRLQDVCPSIYKNENALHAKVHEMVLRAKSIENVNDRMLNLENALKLCKKIGPNINLPAICDLFQSVHWYEAIVDICLTTAQKRDPQSLALHCYKNKDKMDNPQSKMIYESRVECYKLLLDVFGRLVQQSKSLLSPRAAQDYATPDEAKKYAQKILALATQSSDELFHYTLYNWLYEHHQTDKLLEIKSPHLEAYLKEKTSEMGDSIALMDFLWLYYERNGHYSAAAQILAKLAEQNSNEISLSKRIDYLSRAIVCMKSLDSRSMSSTEFGMVGSGGEFLHILQEKIEVARIQLQILQTILKKKPLEYEEAVQELNSSLLNVTDLYQKFAVFFNLCECQLKILHCVGHDDINLIESIWFNILQQEIRSVSFQDSETKQTLLKNKIKELGIVYVNTEKFFPLELIITLMESSNQNCTFQANWLVDTLLELRIPLIQLFETYHKIYKKRINFGSTGNSNDSFAEELDPLVLLEIIIYLINQLDNCNMSISERQYFASKALDLISGYTTDLLFDSSNSKVKMIRTELNKIRIYLEQTVN